MRIKYFVVLSLVMMVTSCSSTKVISSWKQEDLGKTYHHPMIIGVSDSQQTRQIYEKHFVAELAKKNITATPSYKLISSKQKINRDTVIDAVKGTDIDAALVTYLVSSETEVNYQESPLNIGYSDESDDMRVSATLVSTRGRTNDAEIITLKNDLYDAKSRSLVWSAQTRSVAPESIDDVVIDVTSLLIDELISDGMLK